MSGEYINYQQCNFVDGKNPALSDFFVSFISLDKFSRKSFSGLLFPVLPILLAQGRSPFAQGDNSNQSPQASY